MLAQDLTKDALTGVFSRAAFNPKLQEEYERAVRYRTPFALLVIDLDHFKSVNDAFGHVRGDEVLVEFAQRALATVRVTDYVFRYGGDEFVIVLPHTTRLEATRLANRLLTMVKASPFAGKPALSLGISIGVAAFPEDATSCEDLFEMADRRSYAAKKSGRGRVVAEDIFSEMGRRLEAPGRWLERDQPQERLQAFFKALQQDGRGTFVAESLLEGVGYSRFLTEVRKQAQLLGYATLALEGQTGLKMRYYGALTVALERQHPYLPFPAQGEQALLNGLPSWLDAKGYNGLVITLDYPDKLDAASLKFLKHLAALEPLPALALVWAGKNASQLASHLFEPVLQEKVTLAPLSLAAVRIWLRYSLQWEAPDTLIGWFFAQTGGLPALIQTGLDLMLARNILRPVTNGWELGDEWETFPLAEELAQVRAGTPTNLPANLSELVGREVELRQIEEYFEHHQLVTIVGPGGIGKTRLALQTAVESLEKYRQGVYFVGLAGVVADEEMLLGAISTAIGLKLSADKPKVQLLNYLSSKELLLVLDNFEHLLPQSALLAELQNAASQVRLLVTTRERLKLPVEQSLALTGLVYPAAQVTADLENYAAVQLFVQSARLLKSDFVLDAQNGAGVARICRVVEGLPLGLKLAAAWVNVFSPLQLAAQLEERALDLLEYVPGGAGGLTVGGSLRGVLDSFWGLLGRWEREALAQLAVFQGGFSQQAALEIAGASLFFLEGLVMRAFLARHEQGYYQLHELLRQYLTEKLVQIKDVEVLQRQHALYYLQLTESAEPQLRGSQQVLWLNYLEHEHDNLRAALQWAFNHAEKEIAAAMSGALWRFWEQRSHISEGRHWLEASLSFSDEISAAVRARVLNGAGLLAFYQGDYVCAKLHQTESLRLWRALGHKAGIAIALNSLALALTAQGDYHQSALLYEESLLLRRELGDKWGVANCLGNLGQMLLQQEQCDLAQPYLEESLLLRRELNDKTGLGLVLNNLGTMEQCRHNYLQAQVYHAESLAINRELGNRYGIAVALLNLGRVVLALGQQLEAMRRYKESLLIVRELGDRRNLAACLELGAALAAAQGQLQSAVHLLSCADSLRKLIGSADRSFYAMVTAQALQQLDAVTFANAWAEGQSMTLDKVIKSALSG